jgi:hypothetical protein
MDFVYPEEFKTRAMLYELGLFIRRREVAGARKGEPEGAASPRKGEAGEKELTWINQQLRA